MPRTEIPNPTIGTEGLELLGHGVCVVDSELKVISWGERLIELGVSSRSALGRSLRQLMLQLTTDVAGVDRVIEAVSSTLDDLKPRLVSGVALDFPTLMEGRFDLAISPVHGAEQAVLVLKLVTDATKLRAQFERILDSTPDGIFVIDPDHRVRLFNNACGRITGRAPADILRTGCTCEGVVHCHNEEGESLATTLCPARSVFGGETTSQSEEMLLTNASGEERWVETNYSAVTGADGKVEYVIGILRDVHDRKMLEERLNQTEKLASFGQLVAGIAHEIKNPLAIIQSSLDVLENPARSPEQKAEAGQFIREEVRRLDERLRSFLAFARPREVRPRQVLLSGFLKRRLAALEPVFPNVQFSLEISKPEPLVMADEEQLSQVLINLVLNAGEAMDGHGRLAVKTRQHGHEALIEVEDSGPGIPPELRARIFDPFYTTKPNGSGLGLSICYQILIAHGGRIMVNSGRDGQGTLFTIRLPLGQRMEA